MNIYWEDEEEEEEDMNQKERNDAAKGYFERYEGLYTKVGDVIHTKEGKDYNLLMFIQSGRNNGYNTPRFIFSVVNKTWDPEKMERRFMHIEDGDNFIRSFMNAPNNTFITPEELMEFLLEVSKKKRIKCKNCMFNPPYKINPHGILLCESCYDDNITLCKSCGCLHRDRNEFEYCSPCYRTYIKICKGCGEKVNIKNFEYFHTNGLTYCRKCMDGVSFICGNCGGRYPNSVGRESEISRRKICSRCFEREANQPLLAYSTNPIEYIGKSFYGSPPPDSILYGIELEVEQNTLGEFQKTLNAINKIMKGIAICKRDGSLSGGGIEIVTLPMSIEEHKKAWGNLFDNHPKGLTSWNGGRCGMHIHISRNPLGFMRIGKMVVFLNDPANKELITTIAGRYGSGYSKLKKVTKISEVVGQEKYEMLNLLHPNTVEMRIFRGTLNRDHFFSNLEFAQALVRFCGVTSMKKLDQQTFIDFVITSKTTRSEKGGERNEFPYLCKWLKVKKISDQVQEDGEI
jgi:hypothetical protein